MNRASSSQKHKGSVAPDEIRLIPVVPVRARLVIIGPSNDEQHCEVQSRGSRRQQVVSVIDIRPAHACDKSQLTGVGHPDMAP
jgi:hypothetical protein